MLIFTKHLFFLIMTPSEHLFELIQSLSQTEKRYFKVFSSRHVLGEKNNYELLFDAIERQKQYDEKGLKRQFAKASFINRFPAAKNYLYDLILKSLSAYNFNHTLKDRIHNLIQYLEILFDKGLFDHALKIYKKARGLAYSHDSFLHIFELLNWEVRLLRSQSYQGDAQKALDEIYNEMSVISDKHKNAGQYDHLSKKLFVEIYQQGFVRNKVQQQKAKLIMQNPLLKDEKNAISFRALGLYYISHYAYNATTNQYSKAYTYSQKFIEHLESRRHMINENLQQYSSAIQNLFTCQLNLGKYSECQESISKLDSLPTEPISVYNEAQLAKYIFQLSLLIRTGDFEVGLKTIADAKKLSNEIGPKTVNKQRITVLNFAVAYTYFGMENYSAAKTYLSKIIYDIDGLFVDLRSDIQCFARVLNLITQYELGATDMIEYALKSTYRFLHKRDRLYDVEALVIGFIRKSLSGNNTPQQLISSFKVLKHDLEKVIMDPHEKRAMDYFDILSWLESKIEKKKFADVVKEKNK